MLVQPVAVLPGSEQRALVLEQQVLDSALPVQCSYKFRLPKVDDHIAYKSFPYKYFLQFLMNCKTNFFGTKINLTPIYH